MQKSGWCIALGAALLAGTTATSPAVAAPRKNSIREQDWTCIVEVPTPPRRGKARPPAPACLWLPEGVDKVRGLFYPGAVMIEKKLATDPKVRAALAEEKMGVLFYHLGESIIHGGHKYLEHAVAELAKKSGHPEVEFAPMLTAGHSAAGLFCRNVGYWKPERTIGVVMIKSGNFHHAIEDISRSLRTVPLIHFSGEFEQYGPEGGDLGRGLRSRYGTTGPDGKKKNQTQWVMTRMQMLDRRRRCQDNVWTLVVHRRGGHTTWSGEMTDLFIQYIHSLAAARIPKTPPDGKTEVRCIPLRAKDGWLYDADIKNPRHKPAPDAEYTGDKKLAFWAPDETMAKAIWAYHQREPWSHPDPTAKDPPQQRFYPPPILRDLVDAPPPPMLRWSGQDGTWDAEGTPWLDGGKAVPWDPTRQAVFEGQAGRVALQGNQSCTGLVLGSARVLDLGSNRLRVRWHARLADGSELRVQVHRKSSRGIGRGGALSIEGNAVVAGTLRVEIEEGLKDGDYGVCAVKGTRQGDFAETVLPEGCTGRWVGRTWYLTVPKPPKPLSPQERDKRKRELQRQKEAMMRKELSLDGEAKADSPPKLP